KAQIELVARRPDLVGVRRRNDRLGRRVGRVVLELVEPDLRALRDDLEIAGMGDLAHVEHALDVVFHFYGGPSPSAGGIVPMTRRGPAVGKEGRRRINAWWSGTIRVAPFATPASIASATNCLLRSKVEPSSFATSISSRRRWRPTARRSRTCGAGFMLRTR